MEERETLKIEDTSEIVAETLSDLVVMLAGWFYPDDHARKMAVRRILVGKPEQRSLALAMVEARTERLDRTAMAGAMEALDWQLKNNPGAYTEIQATGAAGQFTVKRETKTVLGRLLALHERNYEALWRLETLRDRNRVNAHGMADWTERQLWKWLCARKMLDYNIRCLDRGINPAQKAAGEHFGTDYQIATQMMGAKGTNLGSSGGSGRFDDAMAHRFVEFQRAVNRLKRSGDGMNLTRVLVGVCGCDHSVAEMERALNLGRGNQGRAMKLLRRGLDILIPLYEERDRIRQKRTLKGDAA